MTSDPGGSVSPGEFRRVLGRFGSGITIMSTLQGGIAHAMTANAFTSVSLDPPLVLVCVDKGVRMHDAVLDCGYWAVSVLADSQQPIAERFARSGRDLYSQFDGIATTPGPKTGCPVVGAALSWLECRTWATYEGGDHTIVVGEVLSLGAEETDDPAALMYYAGRYGELRGNEGNSGAR
ncbi:flavin reductase (DIM6/NTAB) family NADH-FMN oxidoreductase RutF [Kribbella amoyensis]|uniref:Flavin reductase (DIM6/NTAB) family NADH-FMN oxidoreductase RutF n=1 Tax=Kribbella amoyensis TaxID=996641 RepID=A0A561B355_9ACTN|nr:flavin reductase family protein [Kribbella amoyensis]TWD73303.1 flavin reductase (DIM6/NTAB) family NADH-FMN oxidoreductase RutF [Kribbella amoyensis]